MDEITEIQPDDEKLIAQVEMLESDHPFIDVLVEMEYRQRNLQGLVPPRPIKADCSTRYTAKRVSGRRPLSEIQHHILHCTQGSTARAAASWFENPDSQGSAHKCLDDKICYRTMRDDQIPWGAPGANYRGLHYEQAGFVNWSQAVWSQTHRRTIMRTAFHVARDCKKYGNPVVWLTESKLLEGRPGISDHATCTKAFGGDHTDPGPNYPRRLFMTLCRGYYLAMKVRLVA